MLRHVKGKGRPPRRSHYGSVCVLPLRPLVCAFGERRLDRPGTPEPECHQGSDRVCGAPGQEQGAHVALLLDVV